MKNLKKYPIKEVKNLHIYGRTAEQPEGIALFWTGSGIELKAKGSELWMELESDYDLYEAWIRILINGAEIARQMVQKGTTKICIFRGMNPEECKHVQILRETQAMHEDPVQYLLVKALYFDGEFLSIARNPYRFEFIGDSITCGEGTVGAKKDMDWVPQFMSVCPAYPFRVSKAFDADFHIISESGWGLYSGWDNDLRHALPPYYTKVCGILTGEHNRALGTQQEWDFDSWQPDVIIVNLGTNDYCGFKEAPFTDPDTGKVHKMRLDEYGDPVEEDARHVVDSAVSFIRLLREKNPNAYILWCHGMMDILLDDMVTAAVAQYKEESGDKQLESVKLPLTNAKTVGSRQHPGPAAHALAAEVLCEKIKQIVPDRGI